MIRASLLLFLAAAPGASTLQDTEPFEVTELISPVEGPSGMPHLARGADGRLYLSWVALRGKESGALRFAVLEDGRWSAPRTIAEGTSWFLNWADFPSLQAHSDGTLLAHWLERLGQDTYAYGVRVALSADGGATWTRPAFLHEDRSAAEHGFASFVPLGGRTFGAIWLDGRAAGGHGHGGPGAMRLYFRTVAPAATSSEADGAALGPEVLLDERVCDCCPTALLRLADGGLVAAYRDRTAAEVRDVSLVRSPDGGATWSEPVPLAEDGWEIPGCPVNGPRLVRDGETLAAAWYTGAGGGAGRVLVARGPADAPGTGRGVDAGAPEGRVDAVFCRGELVVAWLGHDEGRAAWMLRALPPEGAPTEPFVLTDVSAGRASGHLRLAADGDDVIAAWTDPASGSVTTARIVRLD
jgi:hypothetical protein